jgi:hypothetical protein
MKIHSTNYYNTFITISDDSTAVCGEMPPTKDDKTVASMQWEMIINHPYKYTSDDIVFEIFALRNDIIPSERTTERLKYFSKGQPCLRASPLAKRYGWGIHYNENGQVAIYSRDTIDYEKWCNDPETKVIKAMNSSKKS